MEMLNIPPAQPQSAPSAPVKGGTGKEANPFFQEALENAGNSQPGQPETGLPQAAEKAESEQDFTVANLAEGAEPLNPLFSGGHQQPEAGLTDEATDIVDSPDAVKPSLAVAAENVLPNQDTAAIPSVQNKQEGDISAVPQLEKAAMHNVKPQPAATPGPQVHASTAVAEKPLAAQNGLAEPSSATVSAEPAAASPQATSGSESVTLSAADLAEAAATTGNNRKAVGPLPFASGVEPTAEPAEAQYVQQAVADKAAGHQQTGLMESSLGNMLQEVRPLRGELRGRPAVEGIRPGNAVVASSAEVSLQAGIEAQNESTSTGSGFEQSGGSMSDLANGMIEGIEPTSNGLPFGSALESSLHPSQTTHNGLHSLQQAIPADTVEPGAIRLTSGEYLSESRILDQVLERIPVERAGDQSRIVIRMHPEELGEVKLALTMEKDQLRAQLLTQNHQVQEILEKHLPRLHEALGHQGVRLEDIQVSVDSNHQTGREFFDHRQQSESFRGHFNAPTGIIADDPVMAANMAAQNGSAQGLSLRV